jgi:4-amino-4-deoxy-L-arabinose transferase-like glycosyltransferase
MQPDMVEAASDVKAHGVLRSLSRRCEGAMTWASQHEGVVLAGLFALALLARGAYMVLVAGLDSPPTYDGLRYDSFAMRILAGKGYSTALGPTASKPPLYPFFVAGSYWLFGPRNVAALRLLQATLDALTCVLVYFLGKSLAGSGVGLLAAAGAALYPLSLYMSAILYPETLFLFLFVAWLVLFLRMVKNGRGWMALAGGVLFGLCMLARPSVAILLPLAMVVPFFRQKGDRAWRLALVFLAATVAAILPWSIRNYLAFHELVPLTTEGGGVFWSANNPLTDGGAIIPSAATWPGDDYPDLKWSGWSSLGEAASSRKFLGAGLQWIETHPGDFLALVPRKLGRLWTPASFTTHSERQSGRLAALLWVPYLPFLLLVLAGIAGSVGRWRDWSLLYGVILSTCLAAAVFAGGTRYSVPMVPALLVFCAAGLVVLFSRASGRRPEPAGDLGV